MRRYYIGLAQHRQPPTGGRATGLTELRTLCHFRFDDPITAGAFVADSLKRSEYAEALRYLHGVGLVHSGTQSDDPLTGKVGPGDSWALVVYDGRTTGSRRLPLVMFGDHRHRVIGQHPVNLVNNDFMQAATETGCGQYNYEAAALHARAMFVISTAVSGCAL